MRFLIMLEQTEAGFSVQVPDLAIITSGVDIDSAKRSAEDAIRANLEAYRETGQRVPAEEPVERHLGNPEYRGFLFTYIDVPEPTDRIAA